MIVLTDKVPTAPSAKPRHVEQPSLAVQVVEAVDRGELAPEEAWTRYGITPEAIAMWQRARDSVGILTATALH
jgi:hypothetical protein